MHLSAAGRGDMGGSAVCDAFAVGKGSEAAGGVARKPKGSWQDSGLRQFAWTTDNILCIENCEISTDHNRRGASVETRRMLICGSDDTTSYWFAVHLSRKTANRKQQLWCGLVIL